MPGEAVSRRRKVLERGSGEVQNVGFSRRLGKLSPGAEKAVSRNRVTVEEKCVGFPGAGGSCVPAPGKLFPGAGGKAVSRRRESCFPASGKGQPGAGWFDLMWMILISDSSNEDLVFQR